MFYNYHYNSPPYSSVGFVTSYLVSLLWGRRIAWKLREVCSRCSSL